MPKQQGPTAIPGASILPPEHRTARSNAVGVRGAAWGQLKQYSSAQRAGLIPKRQNHNWSWPFNRSTVTQTDRLQCLLACSVCSHLNRSDFKRPKHCLASKSHKKKENSSAQLMGVFCSSFSLTTLGHKPEMTMDVKKQLAVNSIQALLNFLQHNVIINAPLLLPLKLGGC